MTILRGDLLGDSIEFGPPLGIGLAAVMGFDGVRVETEGWVDLVHGRTLVVMICRNSRNRLIYGLDLTHVEA